MYKRILLLIFTTIVVVILASCGIFEGSMSLSSTEKPSVIIAGEEVKSDVTELSLSNKTISDISNFSQLENLVLLDIRECVIEPEDVFLLQAQMPQCEILWSVNVNATLVESTVSGLDMTNTSITDVNSLINSISYLSNLKFINLEGARISVQDYKMLIEEFSDIEIIYNVNIYNISVDVDDKEIDLTNVEFIDASEVFNILDYFSELEIVNFGNHPVIDKIKDDFIERYPNINFIWNIELLGDTISSASTKLDISNRAIDDYDVLFNTFKYLPNLEYVDMCDCNLSNLQMEELNVAYPNTKFVWKVIVGRWEMRTDIKAFSTGNRSKTEWQIYISDNGRLTDNNIGNIKYCSDLIALDIGHQRNISNLEFLKQLPDLKYLIIADTGVTDMSPIANLSKLEYLEMFLTEISDFSPLLNLPNLYHLNCCLVEVEDVDVFIQMKQLKNLWISQCGLDQTQLEILENELPQCRIESNAPHSTAAGWRSESNNVYIDMMATFGMKPYFSD